MLMSEISFQHNLIEFAQGHDFLSLSLSLSLNFLPKSLSCGYPLAHLSKKLLQPSSASTHTHTPTHWWHCTLFAVFNRTWLTINFQLRFSASLTASFVCVRYFSFSRDTPINWGKNLKIIIPLTGRLKNRYSNKFGFNCCLWITEIMITSNAIAWVMESRNDIGSSHRLK